jgi:biopolymer transport protein TolR
MTPYRIKRHRKRKHSTDGHLALVPFIDMMTILVVFLLVHTADVDILPNTKNITIPQSISEHKPSPAVVVMITQDTLYVDGRPVSSVRDVAAGTDLIIAPLKAALMAQNDRILSAAARTDITKREVTIMGDRSTPFKVLKKVMATCTQADYGKVSLAVVERERAAST